MQNGSGTRDPYTEITQSVIELMEESGSSWIKPFGNSGLPVNASTNKEYSGVNILSLWVSSTRYGYALPYWASFKQWKGLGASVRKGEKGSLIVFYRSLDVPDRSKGAVEGDTVVIPMLRHSTVFNVAQVDGWEAPKSEVIPEADRIDVLDSWADSIDVEVRVNGGRAYYSPIEDYVGMPSIELFRDTKVGTATEHYYSTLFHEFVHATGHTSRLDRRKGMGGRFGDSQYAAEELVAELGAAFLCADHHLSKQPRKDHAQYLNSWIKVLKDDKKAIFTASSKASKAAQYLNGEREHKEAEKITHREHLAMMRGDG